MPGGARKHSVDSLTIFSGAVFSTFSQMFGDFHR